MNDGPEAAAGDGAPGSFAGTSTTSQILRQSRTGRRQCKIKPGGGTMQTVCCSKPTYLMPTPSWFMSHAVCIFKKQINWTRRIQQQEQREPI